MYNAEHHSRLPSPVLLKLQASPGIPVRAATPSGRTREVRAVDSLELRTSKHDTRVPGLTRPIPASPPLRAACLESDPRFGIPYSIQYSGPGTHAVQHRPADERRTPPPESARACPTSCAASSPLALPSPPLRCPGTSSRCASSGPAGCSADLQRGPGPDRPQCRAVGRAGAGALHMPAHSTYASDPGTLLFLLAARPPQWKATLVARHLRTLACSPLFLPPQFYLLVQVAGPLRPGRSSHVPGTFTHTVRIAADVHSSLEASRTSTQHQ